MFAGTVECKSGKVANKYLRSHNQDDAAKRLRRELVDFVRDGGEHPVAFALYEWDEYLMQSFKIYGEALK